MPVEVPWADLSSRPHPEGRRMSYESRQKKRRHKRIEAKARQRTPETAARWFLTLAKKPGKFGVLRRSLRAWRRDRLPP